MEEFLVNSVDGLAPAPNPLSSKSGFVRDSFNMIYDIPGWATKRRGMKMLGNSSGKAGNYTSVFSTITTAEPISVWFYDDHLFVYVEDGSGSGIAAWSMVTSAGWHKVVESASTKLRVDPSLYKMHIAAANRRQLISTSAGVKRVAAIYDDYFPKGSTTSVNYSTMYRDAGIPRALDPRCLNAVAGGATLPGLIASTGYEWLLLSSSVAYRVCWIKRDENAILGVGDPSGRVVVRNTSTTTNYATRLKIPIPAGVGDTSYVLQIYRTNVISIDGAGVIPDPGDDMFLAGEYRVTSTDLSNKYILYEDVSFDGLLGAALYTNENQEGSLAGRKQPPICRDIAYFNNTAFFSNTTEKQRMLIKFLAVDSTGAAKGIRAGDIIVAGDLSMEAVAAASEETQLHYFAVDATSGTGSEVIRAIKTAESFCYKYNLLSNTYAGRYYAYNLTTNNDIVGIIQLEEKSIGGTTPAYVGVNRVDTPVQILPIPQFTSTPSNTLVLKCAVATNVGPTLVTVTTASNHNLTNNDLVFLSPYYASQEAGSSSPRFANTDVPAGVYQITSTGATTFTFPAPSGAAASQTDANAATTGGYVHKIFDVATSIWTEARSDNNRRPNRLMWSPLEEPESAPLINFVDIGAAEKAIIRIIATTDSLFIFKEDGLWRLKGSDGDFEIISIDPNCVLVASESPAVVDGVVFAYTANGVSVIDDYGSSSISVSLGERFGKFYRARAANPAIAQTFFGVGHPEEQSYWLFMEPAGTGITPSQDCYRYHVPTKTWSRHIFNGPNAEFASEYQCACIARASRYSSVYTADTQAYIGRMVLCFDGTNSIAIERRSSTAWDLSDVEIPLTATSFNASAKTFTVSSAGAAEVGDELFWYANSNYFPGGYSGGVAHFAIITAINGNVFTLDDTADPMTGWQAVSGASSVAVIRRLPGVVTFEAGNSVSASHFSEVDIAFGSAAFFTTASIGFATDSGSWIPTTSIISGLAKCESSSSISGYFNANMAAVLDFYPGVILHKIIPIRTGVPRAAAMSGRILVSIGNDRAGQQLDIAGVRILYEPGANRVRRTNA